MNLTGNIDDFDPKDLIDGEDVAYINTEIIDDDSLKEAEGLIDNLQDIYADPEFMKANPKFVTRLKAEIEDLRILLKVRKSDETVHDIILGAISKNSNNASLYRALTDVQKTILSTTTDISNKIKDINSMLKNIQLELNFKQQPIDPESTATTGDLFGQNQAFRGSKDFIKQMRDELDTQESQNDQSIQEKEP